MAAYKSDSGVKQSPPKLVVVLGSLVALCVLGIVVVRWLAPDSDFALANILTVGITFLAWIFAIAALQRAALPRTAWRSLFSLPMVVAVVFFSLFELIRVDGDLKPQFRWRFAQATELPSSSGGGPLTEFEAMFAPRATDFPQFLGNFRDAVIHNVSLAADWETSPPRIAWKQAIGEGWSGFAVQGDVAVTMEQRDAQEWVTAYSLVDGALLWHYAIDARHFNMLGGAGPRSTPTIVDNRVFACSAVSQVVCLDLLSGKKIWSQELLQLANTSQADFEHSVSWGRSASALVHEHTLYIPLGGQGDQAQTLVALNADTGDERWRSGTDQVSYSSPTLTILDGVPQVLLISENRLASYAPDTGRELWSTPWPGQSNGSASVSQPILVGDSRILICKGYGAGAQLIEVAHSNASWTPNILWTNETVLRTKFTTAVLVDGYIYGLSDGILECVELKSGKRQWKQGRYRQGQVLRVGQHLLISSERGEIVLVAANPTKLEELGRLPVIGDVTWNTLTLSGNRLLIRNADEAACVLLPLAESSTDHLTSQNGD